MIESSAAEKLLNFDARIGDPERARAQLHGAVAIHNLLREQRVAYLADEVGMGKTYVALGALALFRHYHPNFRVLVIAPRQNIQRKWIKELGNFVMHNVRFADLRVKGVDGHPARECVACENLLQLVHETSLNPNRDFFARLTSFSLPVGASASGVNAEDARRLRQELTRHFPWIDSAVFDLRDKKTFKDNIARAICCALPVFDLVIVDEGHNLKHGFGESVSARNRVLSLVFVWHERFEGTNKDADEAPDIGDWLEERTFFTELRKRPALRDRIWREPAGSSVRERFREQELRARLLASAARLGHAFIDFYVLAIQRLGSLRLRRKESASEEDEPSEWSRIDEYLTLLEAQMAQPVSERGWAAFDELAEISAHFDLILDVNAHDVRNQSLPDATRRFGQLLGRQQPTGGMAGQVNGTLVAQFRMPGYPFVLITTDILQEGEDLHTFCSAVHHYGISWTPSSMEQRTGRIDRVRSHTARRLGGLNRVARPDELLQVYFPHLEDTVEVLQVRRVLERMNTFLRLMHEGLTVADDSDRRIDLRREFALERRPIPAITSPLRTAFPIKDVHLHGARTELAVSPEVGVEALKRFRALHGAGIPGMAVDWEPEADPGRLFGTVRLPRRQQPFTLILRCCGDRLLLRCISPVGQVYNAEYERWIQQSVSTSPAKIGAILFADDRTYNLTVEGDVLFTASDEVNRQRLAFLVRRVTSEADRLEERHLNGADQPLTVFRKDLSLEMNHGN